MTRDGEGGGKSSRHNLYLPARRMAATPSGGLFVAIFIVAGVLLLISALAGGVYVSAQLANGSLSGPASVVADSNATDGHAVRFGSANGSVAVTPGSSAVPSSVPVISSTPQVASVLPSGTIFADSFPGASLNSAWQVISRHGEYAQDETECNTPGQVSVAGGVMTISTIAQATVCGDFNLDGSVRHQPASWPYNTGDIQWKTFNFTYGTVSVRAKFPPKSTSTWPAIWLLGANCQATNIMTADVGYSTCPNIETSSYEEIDNTECFANTWCQLAMSQPGSWASCTYHTPVDSNWHTYSMVWSKTGVAAYVDGESTGCDFTSAAGYKIPSQPMFLIIQTQTGGVGGTPANLPTTFQVSNVTVTQP